MIIDYSKESGAWLSPCRKYRYLLWRRWNDNDMMVFVGLNPSTADATKNDATILRCIGYAKRWGFGGFFMLNAFAFRATEPAVMLREADPVGVENDDIIHKICCGDKERFSLAMWGNHGTHMGRSAKLRALLPNLHCLKLTNHGEPHHLVRLSYSLSPFKMEQVRG
jgi:hypothetical protein